MIQKVLLDVTKEITFIFNILRKDPVNATKMINQNLYFFTQLIF